MQQCRSESTSELKECIQKDMEEGASGLTSSSSSSAAATCVEVFHAIAEALGQLLGHDDGAHGEAIAYGLAQRDHVRNHRLQLKAPEMAAHTPKAALDLQMEGLSAANESNAPCA